MKANKYACIHGHFYQPPRENAWLDVVEMQDSAAPFHDWNERINFECYAPNSSARIRDEKDAIVNIRSNYARISHNFGPTLLSWLEEKDPTTYQAILDSDKQSVQRFGGHGAALAQAYSHMIMPLANQRDIETQVKWGIADFEHRYGRVPEGMWLAETAADTTTLEVLAENGIVYTILAPRQGKAIRKIGDEEWEQLASDSIDPRRPYLCKLPSGKTINLFFYHGEIAQEVAFKGLLNDGEYFASRFHNVFDDNEEAQLAHIATDGESYGHHHRHGEMALAACLKSLENDRSVQLTNYGQYLELFPPTYEAQIHENSSWSCVHGVERWRSNCGCNTGGNGGWNQNWRKPLRDTLNWLRDELIPLYEREASELLKNCWEARNDYIQVILNRTDETVQTFIDTHAKSALNAEQKSKLMRLMEMQRHAMLMFTSCGWFFDEISGLETDQILQYANRAIHYASQVAQVNLHDAFLRKLEDAPSNVYENGAASYKEKIMPAQVGLVRMGMHYAASSLFEAYPEDLDVFSYNAKSTEFLRLEAGVQRLAIGQTTVTSKKTYSKKHFSFAVLYLGQQNMIGNISIDMEPEVFKEMSQVITTSFEKTNLGAVIGHMQNYFGPDKFSVWHLFRDEKRKILEGVARRNLDELDRTLREFFNDNYQLMSGIKFSNIPIPNQFLNAAGIILNRDLEEFFRNGDFHIRELRRIRGEMKKWDIEITSRASISLAAGARIYKEVQKILGGGTSETKSLRRLNKILEALIEMGIEVDLWKSQNLYFSMLKTYKKLEEKDKNEEWSKHFFKLGELLKVKTWEE